VNNSRYFWKSLERLPVKGKYYLCSLSLLEPEDFLHRQPKTSESKCKAISPASLPSTSHGVSTTKTTVALKI